MGHDQLFKELLRGFLKEFLELFVPDLAARLDFSSLQFPNKELFKGFPDARLREPDVVAQIRSRDGEPEMVPVHVEVQAEGKRDLGKRMLEYYSLLWLQFDLPIFPVVLYLSGGTGEGIATPEYLHRLFGREILRFRYARVALARLSAREYVESSPLGAALSALMRRDRRSPELDLRARMLKRVVASELDQGRKFVLVNVIETYFRLSTSERESFRKLVARKEYREMQDVELTWADELRQEGVIQGKRDTLKRLLTAKFGPLPSEFQARIEAVSSGEELDRYLERVLTADTLEELKLSG
jgi:hypothetical protein